MDIAIFGGSFDPPHIGHQKIVQIALERLDIEQFFIIPTYLNPFKKGFHLHPKTRLELINNLFENIPKVKIVDYEIKQQRKVTSFESIEYLKSIYNIDKIYLIIGADNLKTIHLWYNFDKLKDMVKFVVVSRNGFDIKPPKPLDIITLNLNIDISSSTLRDKIDYNYIPQQIQQKVKQIWKQD